jgi:hypothetical protein
MVRNRIAASLQVLQLAGRRKAQLFSTGAFLWTRF